MVCRHCGAEFNRKQKRYVYENTKCPECGERLLEFFTDSRKCVECGSENTFISRSELQQVGLVRVHGCYNCNCTYKTIELEWSEFLELKSR